MSGGQGYQSSIFLDLDTLEWANKADLPVDIFSASTLPYDNSILAFGGYSLSLGALDTIYYYNPDVDEWQLFSHMNDKRNSFPVFYVPDSYGNCI